MSPIPSSSPVAARFVVRGLVQGVGFRAATCRQAQRLELRGLARNLPDGSVEVLAEGAPDAVEALAAWLQHGPPSAQVEAVSRSEAAAGGRSGFEVA
ncbi:acylphosphatase [Aquabacterium sp. A7-Y]|uniref:acylphosphatase n=1 Tax=Aquabacterium sp. A7-Y TaxID=1349605 RepID=UPI00223E569E|nr:acylphosphatase [Aquabacterium sp. A7-Y]MCW7541057.1 acylphosphatase [Aquabacterium sp. A7-Y]